MKLILSLCSIALFSSCSGEYSSPSGLAASTGSSVKFTLTPQNTPTNTSVEVQSATLSSDGTGTLSVLESGTVDTINFTYTFDTGDFTKISDGDQVTVTSSVVATATSQVSGIQPKIQPQVSSINGYVKFIFKGAYYSVKAYFKATDRVGGATLAQAIDDRPNDMQYNGAATVTAPAVCDNLSSATTETLKTCCDATIQEDPKIFNDPACQSYRGSLGSSTPTAPCSCVILYQTDFSINSTTQITASWNNGIYTATYSTKTCTGTTCAAVGACLKPTIEAPSTGYSYSGVSCN